MKKKKLTVDTVQERNGRKCQNCLRNKDYILRCPRENRLKGKFNKEHWGKAGK